MDEGTRLCPRCSQGLRWYPPSIDTLNTILWRGLSESEFYPSTYALRKNIAYNLQYLAYLDLTLDELSISSVLRTQTLKTFTVTAAGIAEAILDYLIRVNRLPRGKRRDFESLIRSAETAQLLGSNAEIYSGLHDLRLIRNKVHLRIQDSSDSDWHSFDLITHAKTRRVLRRILLSPIFAITKDEKAYFQFLDEPAA